MKLLLLLAVLSVPSFGNRAFAASVHPDSVHLPSLSCVTQLNQRFSEIELKPHRIKSYEGEPVSYYYNFTSLKIAGDIDSVSMDDGEKTVAGRLVGNGWTASNKVKTLQGRISLCGVDFLASKKIERNYWEPTAFKNVDTIYTFGNKQWLTSNDGLLYFKEGDEEFTLINDVESHIQALWYSPTHCGEKLFFGTKDGRFFQSTDNGATFIGAKGNNFPLAHLNDDGVNLGVHTIEISPANSHNLLIHHDKGILELNTCEEPENFNPIKSPLADFKKDSIQTILSVNKKLYVVTQNNFLETENLKDWQEISALPEIPVSLVKSASQIYALTKKGLYTLKNSSWKKEWSGGATSLWSSKGQSWLTGDSLWIKRTKGSWREVVSPYEFKQIHFVQENEGDFLWGITSIGEVHRISFTE